MENCNVNTDGMSLYQQENQEVGDWVLENYFFKHFKKDAENLYAKGLELIISPRCNLGCKYCYVHRFRKQIFDESIFDEEAIVTNLKKILKWLAKNEYNPNIEIFSGELLGQEIGFKVLDIIYEHEAALPKELRNTFITIPTNFTFVCDEATHQRVNDILNKFQEIGITIGLSASFDGKYMEQNRPFLHDLDIPLHVNRDDEYYDKVFQYIKDTGSGIHPMVYSKNIDKWPQNWDWFQEMMQKYEIPWESIYLLQVRNEEWTEQNVQDLQKFIEHLYAFVWEKVNHNPEFLINFLLKCNGFNLLGEPFSTTGRGLTCGIQSQLTIRVSDMMCYPCHRLGYKDLYFGQFVDDEEKVLRFNCVNPELMTAIFSAHKSQLAYCNSCGIKDLCVGTCLGSQYESNRNMFTPIPSVCVVMHAIVATSIKCLKKYGAYNMMMAQMTSEKRIQFSYVEKELEKYGN